jgi:SynChlorMet cassette radical SAM/SPASM protein ScmF
MKVKDDKSPENTKKTGEYPLGYLYFYLTQGCNLACSHCYLAPKFDPDGSRYGTLPLELFQKAIAEAIPLGLHTVKLTGGEPLLHPDIIPMLEFLIQKKIALFMETNGVLLTSEIVKTITKIEDSFISISLDSADPEIHDKIRGVNGSFEKATAAIRILADNDLRPQIIMSIMQSNANVGQIGALIDLAEELGASSVKFNIIQPIGRGEALSNNEGFEIKDLIALGRKVESELAPRTSMQLFFDYPVAFRSLRSIAKENGCDVCGVLSILGVLPSGEYALCGMGAHMEQLHFGWVGKDTLAKVWQENNILQSIRKGLPEKLGGVCGHCLMKNLCMGSCVAQNLFRTNSLWAPFWFCEQAHAAGLFPDSRLDLPFKERSQVI